MSDSDRDKWNQRYRSHDVADVLQPSTFIEHWLPRIKTGRALDVACGTGRNALYLAEQGFEVDAVDISARALERARQAATRSGLRVNWLEQDLDHPSLPGVAYQLILVVHFVNLALMRRLAGQLQQGGYLLSEQHLVTEADVTGPGSRAYRVSCDDLRSAVPQLRIVSLEEVIKPQADGRCAALVRLVAQKV